MPHVTSLRFQSNPVGMYVVKYDDDGFEEKASASFIRGFLSALVTNQVFVPTKGHTFRTSSEDAYVAIS
jgi:hypothetical protein